MTISTALILAVHNSGLLKCGLTCYQTFVLCTTGCGFETSKQHIRTSASHETVLQR